MQALSDRLGYAIGPYMSLAYEIQAYLQQHYTESLNLGGYMCAFMLDLGYSADEGYRLYSLCVNSGVHACYSEYRDRSGSEFLPQRCDDVEYTGKGERAVPPA
jgi:citrate synthase